MNRSATAWEVGYSSGGYESCRRPDL